MVKERLAAVEPEHIAIMTVLILLLLLIFIKQDVIIFKYNEVIILK